MDSQNIFRKNFGSFQKSSTFATDLRKWAALGIA